MSNSDPETLNITSSPSASVAVTVPIDVWSSAALNVVDEVKAGALSLRFVILTVIFCALVKVPSVAVTVAVYEDLIS